MPVNSVQETLLGREWLLEISSPTREVSARGLRRPFFRDPCAFIRSKIKSLESQEFALQQAIKIASGSTRDALEKTLGEVQALLSSERPIVESLYDMCVSAVGGKGGIFVTHGSAVLSVSLFDKNGSKVDVDLPFFSEIELSFNPPFHATFAGSMEVSEEVVNMPPLFVGTKVTLTPIFIGGDFSPVTGHMTMTVIAQLSVSNVPVFDLIVFTLTTSVALLPLPLKNNSIQQGSPLVRPEGATKSQAILVGNGTIVGGFFANQGDSAFGTLSLSLTPSPLLNVPQ